MECVPPGIAPWFYPAVAAYLIPDDVVSLMRTCETVCAAVAADNELWRAFASRDFKVTRIDVPRDAPSARARYWEVSRDRAASSAIELMEVGFKMMRHASSPSTIDQAFYAATRSWYNMRHWHMHPRWRELRCKILHGAVRKLAQRKLVVHAHGGRYAWSDGPGGRRVIMRRRKRSWK